MKALIGKLLKQTLLRTGIGTTTLALLKLKPFLAQIGWLRSVKEGLPVDQTGNYLPWFTYPAIYFLNARIKPEMVVFEYGSGHSTLWWSKRVSRVISYEHEIVWFRFFEKKIPANVEYSHRDFFYGGEYSKAILGHHNEIDIVVIDGRDRVNCAKNSLGALRDNGVIIWDNSDRIKYDEGYSYLMQNGFKRLDFEGHGPINFSGWCTSIFYRKNNCLDL